MIYRVVHLKTWRSKSTSGYITKAGLRRLLGLEMRYELDGFLKMLVVAVWRGRAGRRLGSRAIFTET